MSPKILKESAFTLLELLISMAIISALMAIAIPQFSDYRQRSYDLRAASDLRAVAISEEAYFIDNEAYLACKNSECHALPGISVLSPGVELEIIINDTSFEGTASHPKGSGKIMRWDSELGGMQN